MKFRAWVLGLLLINGSLSGQSGENDYEARIRTLEERLDALAARVDGQKREGQEPGFEIEVEELRRQVGILADEIERLRSGEPPEPVTAEQARRLGLGPSATKVYEKPKGVSLAGYGEMLYQNYNSADEAGQAVDRTSTLDFLRAILYAGYRFDDRFLFNSEIEFEHASTEKDGSVSVEFAYTEFLINQDFSLRGGLLLLPMGLVNEFHEPNVFMGALRPRTEQVIIPSSWREGGIGAVGRISNLEFRGYLVNGMDAAGFSGAGLRGGRQGGSKAKAEDLAVVGRLDWTPMPGVFIGASAYRGGAGQGQFQFDGRKLDVVTTIFDAHGQAQVAGWDVRGVFAQSTVEDAGMLNAVRGLTGADAIAERMRGGYIQAGYNLLRGSSETAALSPYYRFESVNTQSRMPAGYLSYPVHDSLLHTAGIEFKPIYNIVIKGDYQWNRNQARSGLNQFNLGLGYSF